MSKKELLHLCRACGKKVEERYKHYHDECLTERYCVICNKFIGKFSPSRHPKTCNKECYSKLVSTQFNGDGNRHYIDGRWFLKRLASGSCMPI